MNHREDFKISISVLSGFKDELLESQQQEPTGFPDLLPFVIHLNRYVRIKQNLPRNSGAMTKRFVPVALPNSKDSLHLQNSCV